MSATQVIASTLPACGPAEWAARVRLAAAYRICAGEGLDDGVFNHFSAAVDGEPGHFLLKPFGPLFEEVTPESLIKVDVAGRIVAGDGVWEPTAFHIHSRIHTAIPRAHCVMHTHMPFTTALTSLADMRIRPINQSAMRFVRRTAYLETYGGLVLDATEGDLIVDAFRGKDILLMANHGAMVIGPTVAHCLYDLHYLEIAARDQWNAMALNVPLREIPESVVESTALQMVEEREMAADVHFEAMLRRFGRRGVAHGA